jgi:hypothetical protein
MPKVTLVYRLQPSTTNPGQYECRREFDVPLIVTTPGALYQLLPGAPAFRVGWASVFADRVELWGEHVIDWKDSDPEDQLREFGRFRADMEAHGWVFDRATDDEHLPR